MKKNIFLLFILFPTVLVSQWYSTKSIYNFEIGQIQQMLIDGNRYVTSNHDNFIIIEPGQTKHYYKSDITGYDFARTNVNDIEKHNGKYYFSTYWGISEYDTLLKSWEFYGKENSGLDGYKYYSLTSCGNRLYIVSHSGFYYLENGVVHRVEVGSSLDSFPYVYGFNYSCYKGEFYYFTMNWNIAKIENDSVKIVLKNGNIFIDPGVDKRNARFGFINHDGFLYFATRENLLYKFDGKNLMPIKKFNEKFSIQDSIYIESFQFDNQGILNAIATNRPGTVVNYKYLLKFDGENISITDIMAELELNQFPDLLQKRDNGDLYFDTQFDFCSNGNPALKVESWPEIFLLKLYPNPVEYLLKFRFASLPGSIEKLNVSIFSYDGKEILNEKPDILEYNTRTSFGTGSVNLGSLERGFYIFSLSNGNWIRTSTMIKE